MTPPVLLIVFNRPALAARTFAAIREARPARLFVHADGARPGKPGEAELCEQTRRATEQIDWECDVKRLYRDANLGCGPGVSSAISWFFEHVEEGIILEDDCVPLPAFFDFCSQMLDRHRDDERVMHVAGMGFLSSGIQATADAPSLLPLPLIWGWATWRRAWRHYSFSLPADTEVRKVIARINATASEREFWTSKFGQTRRGEINTWDYQWVLTLWMRGGVAVTPPVSLIVNEGVGVESTHDQNVTPDFAPPFRGIRLPDFGPATEPPAVPVMAEINRRIFHIAPSDWSYRFQKALRRSPAIWTLYLALRRRWLSLTSWL